MKILIPIDDSDASLHAIDWVAEMQRNSASTEVELVNVRSPPEYYGAVAVLNHGAVDRALREAQQKVLSQALHRAEGAGLKRLAVHAAQGSPAEQIIETAKTHGVDQIVMSTRGRGAVGAILLGSVAQRVAYLAPMAVTLVK